MDQPVADQRPAGVPLWAEPGEVRGWASGTPPTAHGVDSPPWALAAGPTAARGREWGRAQALTKQMPARRRGTRVHTLVRRHWAVTTVTLSCCSTLGIGRLVPSWPQPMARHRTPLPTPWSCRGSWATRTLALMVADPLSCGG